jgi:hypothetical protein
LGRYAEARTLLLGCRAVFEAERDADGLQLVFTGLASLEDKIGDRATAVHFEKAALGYTYQVGKPEDCAMSHGNLASYLKSQNADADTSLAHSLAAAIIFLQTQSGQLSTELSNLVRFGLRPTPPSFAAVVERVEVIQGVRFGALFERLPRTTPDGDAAIAAIWQLVTEEQHRRAEAQQQQEDTRQRQAAVLATLPVAVQTTFELEDEAFGAALDAALADLPAEEAAAIMQQMRDADLIQSSGGPDMRQMLEQFAPLLQRIAAAASNESQRADIEPELADLETKGWMLRQPVQRIWAGERDADVLTASLDAQDSALVRQLLQLLEQ